MKPYPLIDLEFVLNQDGNPVRNGPAYCIRARVRDAPEETHCVNWSGVFDPYGICSESWNKADGFGFEFETKIDGIVHAILRQKDRKDSIHAKILNELKATHFDTKYPKMRAAITELTWQTRH